MGKFARVVESTAFDSSQNPAHLLLLLTLTRRYVAIKAHRDKAAQLAIATLDGMNMIDTDTAIGALNTSYSTQEPVWFHGDLLSGNLLVKQGQLHAVIDFGGLAVGDPTCDLMIAWSLFTGENRNLFRDSLSADDATWLRGRGHSLSQAAIFIPYYLHTNPVGVRNAMRMIEQVLDDYWPNMTP